MAEAPAATRRETEGSIEIKGLKNPDIFRDLASSITTNSWYLETLRVKIPDQPEKPTGIKSINLRERLRYNRAVVEREKSLSDAVSVLDPNYKPAVRADGNSKEAKLDEKMRKEEIVRKYNADLFNKFLDLSEAYLFGDQNLRDLKFSELLELVSRNTIPYQAPKPEEFEKRTASRLESPDTKENNRDPAVVCRELKEKLDKAVDIFSYDSYTPKQETLDHYERLFNYIKSRRGNSVISSRSIKSSLVGQVVYLPQLNLLARVVSTNEYTGEEVEIHLRAGYNTIIPLSDELVAIPYEEMFPPKIATAKKDGSEKIDPHPQSIDITIDNFLDKLLMDEQKRDPDEPIGIPLGIPSKVKTDLITQGLSPFDLTRGELLNAGYVFVNAIGNGEKYILEEKVEVDGDVVDLGTLPFLTEKQLQAAMALDKQEFEREGIKATPQEIAKDMMDYLHGHLYLYHKRIVDLESQLRSKMPELPQSDLLDEAKYMADQEFKRGTIKKRERKMPLSYWWMNRSMVILDGHCPMLNCGHKFSIINDETFDRGNDNPVRLSTVVAHLADHGVSERGGSSDQIYMTMAEYYKLMMDKDRDEIKTDNQ